MASACLLIADLINCCSAHLMCGDSNSAYRIHCCKEHDHVAIGPNHAAKSEATAMAAKQAASGKSCRW